MRIQRQPFLEPRLGVGLDRVDRAFRLADPAIDAFVRVDDEHVLSLNAEYAKIWPNITVKKAPPPDSKEWEGKPDKLQYFSPNPGAGD